MPVCVAIAAWNAERTIGRAIASALCQPEVSEVIVVDDCSTDGTVAAAQAVDDGTGRLIVLRQERNRGPSAARNRALDAAGAEYFAVLDADDYLLPGRFTALLAIPGWETIADNIAFIPEQLDDPVRPPVVPDFPATPHLLTLDGLFTGGLSRRGYNRVELGFLKPVFRLQWLRDQGLRYDESLRLSEDFLLYAAIIGLGGRFLTVPRCGYIAIERPTSLTAQHGAAELGALLAAFDRWAGATPIAEAARPAVARYRAHLAANYGHRRLLDDKRRVGLLASLAPLLREPTVLARVARRIVDDKLRAAHPADPTPTAIRLLLAP